MNSHFASLVSLLSSINLTSTSRQTKKKTTAPGPASLALSHFSGQRPPAELVDAVARLEKRCFSRTDAWDGKHFRDSEDDGEKREPTEV